MACRELTDTGIAVVGTGEWPVAVLMRLGWSFEEATVMISGITGCMGVGPLTDRHRQRPALLVAPVLASQAMAGSGYVPHLYSISIKGVVVRDGKVLLLKNEREEWELPGGRIEPEETPEECVAREITEETQWPVNTGPILDTWIYYINAAERHVFIVTYGCYPDTDDEPVLSHEHKEVGLFRDDEIGGLNMPDGYKRSIMTWFAQLRAAESV